MGFFTGVETRPYSRPLQAALRTLIDDPNPVVRKALLDKLQEDEAAGGAFLRDIAEGDNRLLAVHAARYLRELKFANPQAEFFDFIQSLNYELETGSLLLCRVIYPDLDIGRYCGFLDEVAARVREIMLPPMSAREQCRSLNRVLFHEYGFRGNSEAYSDPRNSFLTEGIGRKRGIPITLSILYILIAQRCRLTLEPVGLPGHFLVGCFSDKMPFFIDPFAGGAFRSPDEVFSMLRRHKIPPKLTYLAPMPVREVLCRNCRNLVNQYHAAQKPDLSRLFARFVDEFEATYRRHAKS